MCEINYEIIVEAVHCSYDISTIISLYTFTKLYKEFTANRITRFCRPAKTHFSKTPQTKANALPVIKDLKPIFTENYHKLLG